MHSATETSAAESIDLSTDYGQQTTVFVHDINDVTSGVVFFIHEKARNWHETFLSTKRYEIGTKLFYPRKDTKLARNFFVHEKIRNWHETFFIHEKTRICTKLFLSTKLESRI